MTHLQSVSTMEAITAEATGRAIAPALDLGALTDMELVQLAKADRAEAFSEIIRRHRNRVAWHCRNYLNNDWDVEDVVQTVFMNAYRHLPRFEPRVLLITWLCRIATNACIDLLRKQSREPSWASITGGESIDQPADGGEFSHAVRTDNPEASRERKELGAAIWKAIHQLPRRQRQAFELREFEGLRYEQIATRLGISIGAVKSRLYYARQMLIEQLGELRT